MGNAVLDILDFASVEASDSTLMFGPGEVGSNGALEISDRGTGRLPPNSRRRGLGLGGHLLTIGPRLNYATQKSKSQELRR